MNQSFEFSEVVRRMNNIVRFGTVAAIDHKKSRVKIKIGKITTAWIPWLTTAGAVKIWNPPVEGEQVAVIAQGGDLAVSVAIPGIFQNKFKSPSDDPNIIKLEISEKTCLEFDKKNDEFKLEIGDLKISRQSEKFELKIGESSIEITPEKISINAPIVDISGLKI